MSITIVYYLPLGHLCHASICKILNTPVMSICLVKQNDGTGALKMQDRKMTDKDIAGGGKCRTGI